MSDESTKKMDLATFGGYGKDFQEKIMTALLTDRKWAEQMMEVFDVNYFELKYLQFLAERYFAYSKKYKEFPTLQLLVTIVRDELKSGSDGLLRDQIVEYLQRAKANSAPGDLPYVKEKSLDFCRKQALKEALEQAVDLVSIEKYERIVEIIRKAVSVGTTPSIGHDFLQDVEARFVRLKRQCCPTGLPELDRKEILNGGLGRGELGVIVANTGIGKSHLMVQFGANAMKAGLNVLHYTFELSETLVGMRYDSNLCGISFNDLHERKVDVIEHYNQTKLGSLIIKEYPMNSCTIHTLRAHVEKLALKGFVPDLIIIDYADIMRSTRQYDSLRHELKLIYEELRSWASEIQLPLWTACFHGDTMISSPCGNFKIRDKVGQSGFPVYSYNHESKRLELRTVKSVYKSADNVEVWKLTLDNGKEIIVTPNHKFMKRDGSYCELRDLAIGDSLMPFDQRISKGSMPGRSQTYRNDGSWEFTYKMVAEWKYGGIPKLHQVHHIDLDKMNDHPDNLELLSISEHYKVHGRSAWDPNTPCSLDRLREVYSERMKQHNPMHDPEICKKSGLNRRGKCVGNDNPMKLIENKKKVSDLLQKSEKFAVYKKTVARKVKSIWNNRSLSERKAIGNKIQIKRFGLSKEERIQKHIEAAILHSTYDEYIGCVLNIPLRSSEKLQIWKNKNHKVLKIEPAGYADVYNMEVDDLHNYALDAGIVVKNSQANRDSAQSDVVGLESMSEAYGKAMVADVVISISRKSAEKSTGWGRLFIAKNRAGRDGLVYPVKIDTARSTFVITGDVASPDDVEKENEASQRKTIREKLKELSAEGQIKLSDVKKPKDDID